MISLKQANPIAKKFVSEVFDDAGEPIGEIGLEEVSRSRDGRHWLVTVGFIAKARPQSRTTLDHLFAGPLAPTLTRQYRVVEVDAETGEPIEMRIRAVSGE